MESAVKATQGTLKYRLKNPKSKIETPILLDYSFGRGNRIRYSSGYKILPKHWDSSNQRVRSISTINNREAINNKLKEFDTNFFRQLSELEQYEKTNKILIKRILDNVVRQEDIVESKASTVDFFTFADNFIEKKKSQLNSVGSTKLSPITIRSYNQTITKLKDFNKHESYGLDFEKFDLDFYYAFIEFLEDKNLALNTIGKHIKNLITILNKATELGVNSYLKYKHSEFKPLREETSAIYLTESEINSIYKLDLTDNKEWELARDIFLIGYYTGQRVSDYNGLKKNQIIDFNGVKVIKIKQKKVNGTTVFVPIHSRVKAIIKRYKNDFPPKIYDQELNKYIKKVARKAKIKDVITTKRTIGGKEKVEDVKKWELVGSHTARRSFCTNAYLSKMPVIDIMAISGHKTEKEFYKYIRVTPQERAVKIAESKFFKANDEI